MSNSFEKLIRILSAEEFMKETSGLKQPIVHSIERDQYLINLVLHNDQRDQLEMMARYAVQI